MYICKIAKSSHPLAPSVHKKRLQHEMIRAALIIHMYIPRHAFKRSSHIKIPNYLKRRPHLIKQLIIIQPRKYLRHLKATMYDMEKRNT